MRLSSVIFVLVATTAFPSCLRARSSTNHSPYDASGYNGEGYDKDGYDRDGYNRDGYDREGYNRAGLDVFGLDRLGRPARGTVVPTRLDLSAETKLSIREKNLTCVLATLLKSAPYYGGPAQAVRFLIEGELHGAIRSRSVWIYFPIRHVTPWERPGEGLDPSIFAPERKFFLIIRQVRRPSIDKELRSQASKWYPIPYKETLVKGLELQIEESIPSIEEWTSKRQQEVMEFFSTR